MFEETLDYPKAEEAGKHLWLNIVNFDRNAIVHLGLQRVGRMLTFYIHRQVRYLAGIGGKNVGEFVPP